MSERISKTRAELAPALDQCQPPLNEYLKHVPRRGTDVILHLSAETVEECAAELERLADDIRQGLRGPRYMGGCGISYWAEVTQQPWFDIVRECGATGPAEALGNGR